MKTHKEYMRKVVNEWAKRNPEKIRAAGRRSAAKRYPLNRDSIIHTTTMNNIRRRGASGHHTFAEWNEMKKKSNFTCLCCGRKEPEIKITRDHKVPLNKGGTNNISNIQPLCFSCNSSKKTGLNCQMNH